MERWDYIVVGAGSAGCVVARRLTDDSPDRVLLIEAGPPAKDFWFKIPAGMTRLIGSERFDWRFMTEAEPALNGRRIACPRGRTLGGSSAINGMVYTRGNRRDYDHWASLGNEGWGWDDVLPYFRKLEDNGRGASAFRGAGGPQQVSDASPMSRAVLAFVESAERCGIPHVDDLSVCGEEGVGRLQATIHGGERRSAYDAFVAPVRDRTNLSILTDAHVLRVVFDGATAVGVDVLEAGRIRRIFASKEVILSAGVINSPQLLMLSGVGDGTALRDLGIDTVAHVPGVGKNLQDHYGAHLKFRAKAGWSFNHAIRGWRKYMAGAQYVLTRTGFLTSSVTPVAAFVRSGAGVPYADLEIGCRPITYDQTPSGLLVIDDCPGISSNVYRVRPASRGEILLRSPDPREAPVIRANYMTAAEDQEAAVAGLRCIRRILATEPLASGIVGEMGPGAAAQSDDDLLAFVLKHGKSSYHPVGTCTMGVGPMAVVDPQLRVRGVERLRVIDASVMPTPSSGNTNAAAIMIGEKGAAMVREAWSGAARPASHPLPAHAPSMS